MFIFSEITLTGKVPIGKSKMSVCGYLFNDMAAATMQAPPNWHTFNVGKFEAFDFLGIPNMMNDDFFKWFAGLSDERKEQMKNEFFNG